MNEWKEFTGKTVDDALTNALLEMQTTSDKIEYEVLEKETSGFLGMGKKPARIQIRLKKTMIGVTETFLTDLFRAMNIDATFEINYNKEDGEVDIEIKGEEMGILIGKRGQTLDSLQYLTSLVVNKESDEYLKVKVDTENYRQRRKETLENLAKNIASKVKRTRRSVTLEPMNSFERRIIHSALQNDAYVETHSEGEEPYRKVVVTLKKGVKDFEGREGRGRGGRGGYYKKSYRKDYNRQGSYRKDYKSDYSHDESVSEEKQIHEETAENQQTEE